MEAMRERVTRRDLRHDRHTVSLLTDHLVFSPKYRGKVLEGEVAEAPGKLSGFHLLLSRFKLFMSPQKWYIKNKKIKNRKTFFFYSIWSMYKR